MIISDKISYIKI